MCAIWVCSARSKLLNEIVVIVEACPVAGGGRDIGGNGGVGAEHLDRLKYGEPENLEAALLEFSHFGICPRINDHIGHNVVCLEIVKRDDHPAGRGGRGGRDGGERGDR
jgi:hypothetical protein